ncbi:MAG TPA: DUF2306 domain-containing protein [Chitinophagaceae bacterium]|nr:DUF2306 domain-containing protein [Chitinophagaceae bacterium]MCB9055330.1 DUF2306 domain-containing protein [Chitinophagales bacterium]HPG12984.1 DUF2306 domain-containing protein [Chitinophagaceae bacterium]HRX92596.1 DUF2306 domain-containing protein [Chitinophagaceae bacterium]
MQNSRILTLQQSSRILFRMLFWIPVTGLSLLLIYNTLPYFSFSKDFDFIAERSLLFQSNLYNTCFYIHIAAGALCIGTALIQFSRYMLKKSKAIHRISGKIYVAVVLFLGAPTGLYMAFFAKGSFWERCLFMFMAGWWFTTTLYGLSTIHKRNIVAHKVWMIRSYAMAMTAVTFRVYYILLYLLDWKLMENYQFSLWVSVLGNMLIAEWIIYRQSKNYLKSFSVKG